MKRRGISAAAWMAGLSTAGRVPPIEAYSRKQCTCAHVKRDPRGKCYECGHQIAAKDKIAEGCRETGKAT